MKYILSALVLMVVMVSCQKESKTTYKSVMFKVYTSHQDYQIIEPLFDTLVEQVLEIDAYHIGGVFETVSEQVLLIEGYTRYQIATSDNLNLVLNTQTGETDEIPCFEFLDPSDWISTEVPSQYITRTYQKLITDGDGDEVPAVYGVRSYQRLNIDTQIVPVDNATRASEVFTFTIPEEVKLLDYIREQLVDLGRSDCLTNGFYQIVD